MAPLDTPSKPCIRGTLKNRQMDMPQPTRGPAPRPEMHRSSSKRMFPAWVRPGLHFAEWTRHTKGISYLVAAHSVHLSGWRLQLNSQLGGLTPPQTNRKWSRERTGRAYFLFTGQIDNNKEGNSLTAPSLSIIGHISRAHIKLKNTIKRVIWRKWSLSPHCKDMLIRFC